MKKVRRLASLLLALVMVFAMTTNAFAANITIAGGAAGSEYAAYKLLNATDGGEGKFAYTLNEKYTKILQTVTDKEEQADIVDYIAGLDEAGIREFADKVYKEITEAESVISADYVKTAKTDGFVDVAQGYYLIAETKVGDSADTISLVMLDTAGDENITVTTKEDKPTVEKKVEEKNDSTGESSWGDSADYDIGDDINYKITGTVSSKYADYKSYYYSFSDTMATGLTLDTSSIKVMIGDTDVTSQFDIKATEHSFTATANLKKLTDVTITGDTEIVVTYTATLNENAVSGTTGNKNEVVLKYENDPYHEGEGEPETPGETPKDENIVFTYDVIVDKVDKDGKALEGAGFTLYKWDATEDAWVAVGTEITDVTTFEFKKLDEGNYKLVETTVPEGYNKADDIEFEIVSTLEGTTLENLTVTPAEKFAVTLESGKIETDVVNNAGTELPETGGIGTTIFYVVGGILVAAAVILLVTKRRMKIEE